MEPLGDAQAAFAAELARLRTSDNSGPADRRLAVAGLVTAAVGAGVIVVSYSLATGYSDQRDQMEVVILGLLGLALVVFGSALYLRAAITRFARFWLLRLIYEGRDLAARATGEPVSDPPDR